MNIILRRLFFLFFQIAIIFFITNLLIFLTPGDPVDFLLGQSVSQIDADTLRDFFGLNQTFFQQTINAFLRLLQFDFGMSFTQNKKVLDIVLPALKNTFYLGSFAVFLALTISIPIGLYGVFREGYFFRKCTNFLTSLFIALPNFILAPILVLLFAVYLKILPISGMDTIQSIILPGLTLAIGLSCLLIRMLQECGDDYIGMDFIKLAKAKGLSLKKIYLIHLLRMILIPLVTVIGIHLGSLLTGAIITEVIFSWDGIGQLLITSIQQRDYPIIQASVFFIATIYVVINFSTEIIYQLIDPRFKND